MYTAGAVCMSLPSVSSIDNTLFVSVFKVTGSVANQLLNQLAQIAVDCVLEH